MSEPIRVCEFVGNMNGGGVEAVVMNYFQHVDRSKVQFDFVVTDSSTIVPRDEMEALGARVFTVPAYTQLSQFQKASHELFSTHPEWRIVHSHMNALSVFPLREAARAGVPVRIAHSHSTSGKGEFVRNMVKSILRTQANKYPTERFACTEHAGRWLFGKAPFEVVPNPVDFPRYAFDPAARRQTREAWGLPEGVLTIGHVGRWASQKNQIFLLRVLKVILDGGMDAWLVLVGDGPDRPAIEGEAERLGVSGRLVTPGYMDSARAYSAFDVFVFPSRYEGLGMATMEAQAAGLPCIVSDAVPREVAITDRCAFLPIDDPLPWAEAAVDAFPSLESRSFDLQQGTVEKYEARRIASWLTSRYLELCEGAVA
jgi:glycosyltransferase involved in cell wall biosynthesis